MSVTPRAAPFVPSYIFPHNWVETVRIDTTWQTDIVRHPDRQPEVRSLVSVPTRTIQVLLNGLTETQASALYAALKRWGKTAHPFPIYCDYVRMTQLAATLTAGRILIPGDFSDRRYYEGQRVALVLPGQQWDQSATDQVLYSTVAGFPGGGAETGIELFLTEAPPVGTIIYPMMDCEVHPTSRGQWVTDRVAGFRVTAIEVAGEATLPPSSTDSLLYQFPDIGPFGSVVNTDTPVFFPEHNWTESVTHSITRDVSADRSGKSEILTYESDLPTENFGFVVSSVPRSRAWEFLKFFDSARGRFGHFFLPHPMHETFRVLNWTTTTVTVQAVGELSDWEDLEYVGFYFETSWGKNGVTRPAVFVGKVSSITATTAGDGSQSWEFAFEAEPAFSIPVISSDQNIPFARLTPLIVSHFSSDSVTEVWQTDEFCTVGYSTEEHELPEDRQVVGRVTYAPGIPGLEFPGSVDATFLFDIRQNCFSAWRTGPSIHAVRSLPYPDIHHRLARVYDARGSFPDILYDAELGATDALAAIDQNCLDAADLADPPRLTQSANPRVAGSAGFCHFNRWYYRPHLDISRNSGVTQPDLWSASNGWTFALVTSPGVDHRGTTRTVLDIRATNGNPYFQWSDEFDLSGYNQNRGLIRMFNGLTPTGGVIGSTLVPSLTEVPVSSLNPRVWIFRCAANNAIEVYVNGGRVGTTLSDLSAFPDTSSGYSSSEWFGAMDFAGPFEPGPDGQSFADSEYGERPALMFAGSWPSYLSNADVNQIGRTLARAKTTAWTDLP